MKWWHKLHEQFLQNPGAFLLRQVYKLIFVLPFQGVVWLLGAVRRGEATRGEQAPAHCFIITSVIYPQQKKLTYAATRSVFHSEERAQQTLQTIASIRAKAPQAIIVLVEAGLRSDLPLNLAEHVDTYLYVGDRSVVRKACDSRFKSLGEAVILLFAYRRLPPAKFYFKISGRYFLNDDFNLAAWTQLGFTVFYIRDEYISTRLYGFDSVMKAPWRTALLKGLPLALLDYPIEHTLAKYIPARYVTVLEKLGVSGADATSGAVVKE